MPNHEPVKVETRTDAEPRPPARVRYLAAATQVGFWFDRRSRTSARIIAAAHRGTQPGSVPGHRG